MWKMFPVIGCLAVLASTSAAQTIEDSIIPEPEVEVDFSNLKSPSDLNTMMSNAKNRLATDGCEVSVSLFSAVSVQSNATANIIRTGLEPYYRSGRDEKEAFSRKRENLQPLIEMETASNNMIRLRNEAWVREGVCLLELGERDRGISTLSQALNRISVDPESRDMWLEARAAMWALVGLE